MTKTERLKKGFSLGGMSFLLFPSMQLCTLILPVPDRMGSKPLELKPDQGT